MIRTCLDGSFAWEAEVDPCTDDPPEIPCEPTGHGEGVEGFEYECTDGINNDCDEKLDCQEDRCSLREDCVLQCDADRDNVRDVPCGGPDCHPNNPLAPGRRINGEFVESDCFDNIDNDCDQLIDCRDTNCNQSQQFCPQCDLDNDGILAFECDGTDCHPQDSTRPEGTIGNDGEYHETSCDDGVSNDCDEAIDCADSDCVGIDSCPAVSPTPPVEPSPSVDPCQEDPECCGRGTHIECYEGECEPDIEICYKNPYSGEIECETRQGECEPDWCVEVCN